MAKQIRVLQLTTKWLVFQHSCQCSCWLELPPRDMYHHSRKLGFLHRDMTNEESICRCTFSAMVDDVEELIGGEV